MMRIAIINGPNLNLLGTRQPEVYGSTTLSELEGLVSGWAEKLGVEPVFHQSNDESELVSMIQDAGRNRDALVINPGGFTHTSVAIGDAVASIGIPVVEVHLSDIHSREPYRRISLVEPGAVRQISGRGTTGYRDAIRHLVNRSRGPFETIRYGPDPKNIAEIRTAGSGRLVLLIHGGFWLPGWDRDQLDSAAIDLTERGLDTLNIEYRVTPPWPGSGHDVAMAIDWAAPRYDHITLLGHSAGAYLAIWASLRSQIDGCVGLSPITDLTITESAQASRIVESGGPASLDVAPGTVLFHDPADEEVSYLHSRRAAAAILHPVEGVGHFGIIDPRKPHWEGVVAALEDSGPGSELPEEERAK